MEQVEGGDLIVNRGQESRPKEQSSDIRDLNAVEGLKAALKLSEVRRVRTAVALSVERLMLYFNLKGRDQRTNQDTLYVAQERNVVFVEPNDV